MSLIKPMHSQKQLNSILLSWPRSGTNFFLDVYSKIFPNDLVFDEIFREGGDNLAKLGHTLQTSKTDILEQQVRNPEVLWKMIEQRALDHGGKAIAKVFYYHSDNATGLWNHFRKENKIIHLIRRNLLDIFLSYKIAEQTGVWKIVDSTANDALAETKNYEIKPFRVSMSEIENFVAHRRRRIANCRSFFLDSDFHEIYYDDISQSTEACVKGICNLFNVPQPNYPVQTTIKKQRTRDPREFVLNYKEIQNFDREEA